MKIAPLVFLMLALPFAVLAQMPKPAPNASGDPETVYDYGQRVRDNELSQRFIHSLMRPSYNLDGQFARWKQSLCLNVVGMAFPDAYYVERHIRTIARKIGAPLDPNNRCVPNILIFVSAQPQVALDVMWAKRPLVFAASPRSDLKMRFPVQAWYYGVARDYNGHYWPDIPWQDVTSPDIDPSKLLMGAPQWAGDNTRLKTGIQPELRTAIILVDSTAISDMTLDSFADYLALMSLAQAPATGRCQPAPSIANLFLTSCETDFHTTSLSNADLAMLTSLYQTPDQPERVQLTRLLNNMRRNLEAGDKR